MNPQEACSAPDSTLLTTPIRGYRTWRLTSLGQLHSTAVDFVWASSEVTAGCAAGETATAMARRLGLTPSAFGFPEHDGPGGEHKAPGEKCACGIYGWYDPDDTRHVRADVFGVIEVQGDVQLGDHGFRAERARVLAVLAPAHRPVPAAWTDLERQGVKVYSDRAAMLADFPPDDMTGLVDHECGDRCASAEDSLQALVAAMTQAGMSAGVVAAAVAPRHSPHRHHGGFLHQALASATFASPPPRPKPRRLRYPAVALAGAVTGINVASAIEAAYELATDPSWAAGGLLALYAFCVWGGVRLVKVAIRWGWPA